MLPVENPPKAKSKARENAIAELMYKEYVAGAVENSRRGLDDLGGRRFSGGSQRECLYQKKPDTLKRPASGSAQPAV